MKFYADRSLAAAARRAHILMSDFLRLVGQIVGQSGATPDLDLIKRFAWTLIGLVAVPPVIHDLWDHFTPRTPEEQQDIDQVPINPN
eukprot:SAG31_NODE_1897_length_6964_cov_2.677349_2_plen_87_part_00